jgi:hypothetical protein
VGPDDSSRPWLTTWCCWESRGVLPLGRDGPGPLVAW